MRLMRTTSPRFEDSDVAFHYAIATIPKNPIYVVMHRAIIDWLVDQRRVTLSYPGQNRVAFDSHVPIFEAKGARSGTCRCPHALAPGSGWQALLEGPEGGQVNGSWSPSSSSQNRLRWRHSARSSMRMRRCHGSANRARRLRLADERTIASCFGKSMIAARPSHLQSPH